MVDTLRVAMGKILKGRSVWVAIGCTVFDSLEVENDNVGSKAGP